MAVFIGILARLRGLTVHATTQNYVPISATFVGNAVALVLRMGFKPVGPYR